MNERITQLQTLLREASIDGILITQNVSIFYYTGSMQTGILLVPAYGEPLYFVRRSVERAQHESSIRTMPLGSFSTFAVRALEHVPGIVRTSLAIDADVCPAQLYLKLQAMFGGHSLIDGSALLRTQRMIKDVEEVASIERAATLLNEALHEVLPTVRIGMSELEFSARIEFAMRMRGHEGFVRVRAYNLEVFSGMLGAGEAIAEAGAFDGPAQGRGLSPAAAQGSSRRPIQANEPILVDIGCTVDGYLIDQTRTVVLGALPRHLQHAYEASESILRELERDALRPGVPCEAVHQRALELAAEVGLADSFMGALGNQVKFVGHGIGLEVDEWPIIAIGSKHVLEAGMVIAIEPKFTFVGEGVVGIENTYLITATGCRPLTKTEDRLFVLPPL